MSKYPKDFKFERECPTCNNIITYKSYQGYESGLKRGSSCQKCGCGWSKGQTKETNPSIAKMAISISIANKGCIPWNVGLTRETHPSLKIIGDKRKGVKHTNSAREKISNASITHWKDLQYRELVISRVKESFTEERITEWRTKMETNGQFTPLSEKNDVEQYRQLVWYHTRRNDLNLLPNSEKRGKLDEVEDAYHLDHVYSITSGYINKVSPEIIGSIYNLRFIPAVENIKKNIKNNISLKKLKKLYYGKS